MGRAAATGRNPRVSPVAASGRALALSRAKTLEYLLLAGGLDYFLLADGTHKLKLSHT